MHARDDDVKSLAPPANNTTVCMYLEQSQSPCGESPQMLFRFPFCFPSPIQADSFPVTAKICAQPSPLYPLLVAARKFRILVVSTCYCFIVLFIIIVLVLRKLILRYREYVLQYTASRGGPHLLLTENHSRPMRPNRGREALQMIQVVPRMKPTRVDI